jgi:hypothetical protein
MKIMTICCTCTSKRDPLCTDHHVHRMDTGTVLGTYTTEREAVEIAQERQGTRIKNGWHHHYGTSHPTTIHTNA